MIPSTIRSIFGCCKRSKIDKTKRFESAHDKLRREVRPEKQDYFILRADEIVAKTKDVLSRKSAAELASYENSSPEQNRVINIDAICTQDVALQMAFAEKEIADCREKLKVAENKLAALKFKFYFCGTVTIVVIMMVAFRNSPEIRKSLRSNLSQLTSYFPNIPSEYFPISPDIINSLNLNSLSSKLFKFTSRF